MKVNEGSISFDFNTENSLESMVRQVVSLNNTPRYTEYIMRGLTAKTGKYRYQSGSKVIDRSVLRAEDTSKMLLDNIESTALLKSMLQTISTYPKLSTKKILLINFMNKGTPYSFRDDFKLVTDPNNLTTEYDPSSASQIIEDNKYLNKILTGYFNSNDRNADLAWSNFFDRIKPIVTEEGFEYIKVELHNRLIFEQNDNMITAMFDYLLEPDLVGELRAALTEFRSVIGAIAKPKINYLCQLFEISESTYKRNELSAINLLVTTYGIDLTREVIS
jgi:hypothetical protein